MESLIAEGVDTIFGYPGGAIMPVYDALYHYRHKIHHVLVRHEQGAAHAAEGYARITGRPGVCIATSGPGATNLVTGLGDAIMDSVPLICITGQVHKDFVGTEAFQEIDVIGVTAPVTKWNYQVTEAAEVAPVMKKAFHIARSGRPGPVLVDITKNAQIEKCSFSYPKNITIPYKQDQPQPDATSIKKAARAINEAKKPLLLVGHGVLIAKAENLLRQLAEKAEIPVISTLHGLSAFPTKHRLFGGFAGMHGNYAANMLTNEADVLIAIGMRFDDRVTGNLKRYAKNATIIHIEIDPSELNKIVIAQVAILSDLGPALQALLPRVKKTSHRAWLQQFKTLYKQEFNTLIQREIHPTKGKIKMAEVVHLISNKTKGQAVIVADVGQHQMVTARYYQFEGGNSFMTSGGAGTMGFGVPAAMGAKLGTPKRQVVAIVGDGSFQMTIQELATIAQEKLPVKIVILNNNFLGMVRQWQELFFDKRYSFVDLKNPDFVALAKGFYIDAHRVTKRKDLAKSIDVLLKKTGPYVLEVEVEKEEKVFPMVPSGAGVDEVRLQ